MRTLAVAVLTVCCGSLGALLWERTMKDAPDWLWRLMAFAFWFALAVMAMLTDAVFEQAKLHPKVAISVLIAWSLVGALFVVTSKRFRSAQLEMRFIKEKSPYFDRETLNINGTICNAELYRVSISADKPASVSVSVDGVCLETSERHDVPLHRMGDQTNIETVTDIVPGRPRYWDVLLYAKALHLVALKHIQGNLPQTLYPVAQSFTITATAPGTREISRIVNISTNESEELLFSLADAKETKRLLRSSQ